MKMQKRGISLIVLVITIIVMIILAATIIISLNNSGIISNSQEATFKQNIGNYKDELGLYLGDKLAQNPRYDTSSLNATDATVPSITDIIKSMKQEDKTKFEILAGDLRYIGTDENELAWCESLGIKTINSELTEAEYNLKYKDEIAKTLEYGTVTDGVYKLKNEYKGTKFPASKIVIPYGVTTIGFTAFSNCEKLTEVVFPSTVTKIEAASFQSCNFKKIVIPGSIKTIEGGVFVGCDNLTEVILQNGVLTIENGAFQCDNLKKVKIPSSVTSIDCNSFSYSVESLEIDKNNKIYDSRDNCNAIIETATNTLIWTGASSTIPNSVININANALGGIKDIIIPAAVTNISNLGSNLDRVNSIKVDKDNKVYDSRDNCNAIIETATNTLMKGCVNTIVPNSVTSIADGALSVDPYSRVDHLYIEQVVIPANVNKMGEAIFHYIISNIYIEGTDIEFNNTFANLMSGTTIYVKNEEIAKKLEGKVGSATISTDYSWTTPENKVGHL